MWFSPLLSGGAQQQASGTGLFLRNVSQRSSSNSGTVDPGKPAGTQPTDILIAVYVGSLNPGQSVTPPSGWTSIPSVTFSSEPGHIYAWWAPGYVASTSFVDTAGGAGPTVTIYAFAGADQVNPIRAGAVSTSETTTITAPSVNANAGDSLIHVWFDWQVTRNFGDASPGTNVIDRVNVGNVVDGAYANRTVQATVENLAVTGATATQSRSGINFTGKRAITIAIAAQPVSPSGYRSIASVEYANVQSVVGIVPDDAQSSDTLVAILTTFNNTLSITGPAGWTRRWISGLPHVDNNVTIWTAPGYVSRSDLRWSTGNLQNGVLYIAAYSGRSEQITASAILRTTGTSTIQSPSITAAEGDSLLTIFTQKSRTTPFPGSSIPADLTVRGNAVSLALGTTSLVATKDGLTAGPTDTYTVTETTSATRYAVQILLHPKITFTTQSTTTFFNTSHNVTIAPPSQSQVLVVWVRSGHTVSGLSDNLSGVYVADSVNATNSGFYRRTSGSIAGNITISWTTSSSDTCRFVAFYMNNVDKINPLDSASTGTTSFTATPSIPITTTRNNSLILSNIHYNAGGDPTLTGIAPAQSFEFSENNLSQFLYLDDAGLAGSKTIQGTWYSPSTSSYTVVAYRSAVTTTPAVHTVKKPWNRQPQGAAQIDWSNPLTRGLIGLWCPPMGLRNLVSGVRLTPGPTVPVIGVSRPGRAFQSSGQTITGNRTQYFTTGVTANPSALSMLCVFESFDAPSSSTAYGQPFGRDQYAFNYHHNNASYRGAFTLHVGATYPAVLFPAMSANTVYTLAGSWDGSNMRAWQNGVFSGQASASGALDTSNGADLTILGGHLLNNAAFNGRFYIGGLWNRALSDNEIKSISANPWQIFKPLEQPFNAGFVVESITTAYRPNSDVTTTGWTATPGPAYYDMIDEQVASDLDYVTSPNLNGSQGPIIMGINGILNPGYYYINVRARYNNIDASMRVQLLDGTNAVVGESAWQALTSTQVTYQLPVLVATGTASRVRIDVIQNITIPGAGAALGSSNAQGVGSSGTLESGSLYLDTSPLYLNSDILSLVVQEGGLYLDTDLLYLNSDMLSLVNNQPGVALSLGSSTATGVGAFTLNGGIYLDSSLLYLDTDALSIGEIQSSTGAALGSSTATGTGAYTLDGGVYLDNNLMYLDTDPIILTEIVPALATSLITGTAPLAVHFDATATTSENVTDPFRQITYTFDYGDTGSGTWSTNGQSKNSDSGGPIGAHVYETPGTYTVTMTANDGYGTNSTTTTITVADPDVVYAGTNTICIDPSGGTTGGPVGCQYVTSMPAILSNRRYLIKRGSSISGFNVPREATSVRIGAYGTGAKPIITGQVTFNIQNPIQPTVAKWAEDIVVSDLSVENGFGLRMCGRNIMLLRCEVDKPTTNSSGYLGLDGNPKFWIQNGDFPIVLPASDYYIPEYISIVECYQRGSTTNTGAIVGMYGSYDKLAFMGNDLRGSPEHNVRFPLIRKSIIQHNILQDVTASNIRVCIKLHAYGTQETWGPMSASFAPKSYQNIIRYNTIGAPDSINSWSTAFQPQNTSSTEGVEDTIIENNVFINSPTKTNDIILGPSRRVTTRGNTRNDGSIRISQSGSTYTTEIEASWRGPYYGQYTG